MALNIGGVNFGVDANTDGLRKAVRELNKFQRVVDKTAQIQKDGALKVDQALVRQESAIKRAFQATLKLQQAQRGAGASKQQIGATTRAFNRLTQEMTSGKLTTVEFTRAQDAFATKLGRSKRAITDLQKASKAEGMAKLTETLRNLESASVLAVGPLSGLGARIRSIGAIAGRSTFFMVGLLAGITAAIVGFSKLASAAVAAGRVFETSMARFEASSGSLKTARKEMAFVIKTAQTLGLRIDTSAKAFSRLTAATRGTSLEGQGARKVFLAVSKAAAALRLGAGEVEGTFRAIEQIMSKGSVQAEELRGQLGERLPGAFRIAAESMGVTTRELGEMLKSGEVLSDEFLPKFAAALEEAFGEAALKNVDSFQGSMNALANEGLLFSRAFNEVANVSGIFIGAIKGVTSVIKTLRTNLNNIIAALVGIGAGMLVAFGPQVLGAIIAVAKALKAATLAMIAWNLALAANPLGAVLTGVVKLIAAVTVGVAAFFGMKSVLDDITSSLDDVDDALDDVGGGINAVGALGQEFKTLSDEIKDAQAELKVYEEALGFVGRIGVNNIDLLITRFETMAKVEGLAQPALEALSAQLSGMSAFVVPLTNDVDDLADAYFRFVVAVENAKARTDKVTTSNEALAESLTTIAEIQQRIQALRKGQKAADFFDDITASVREFDAVFKDTNVSMEDRLIISALYRAVLEEEAALVLKNTEAEKARKKALKDTETAQRKLVNGVIRANEKIDILRAQNRALAEGPDSFEVFTKVTQKVMKFRDALERLTKNQALINALTAQYKAELETALALTDRFARAGVQMSQAVVNGLEDIILQGGKVKDMLRDLARELFRLALRAAFLDPLQQILGGIFGGGLKSVLFPGAGGAAAAVPGGGGGVGDIGGFSHGGGFTVGGSGNSEVPVGFFAKPGEDVTIRRGDQGGGGGGDINVNINAPGADVGTIARIEEIVRVKMVPQIIRASSDSTLVRLRRPRFA